jgi:ParB-like chromosome segregation protein Spo0J
MAFLWLGNAVCWLVEKSLGWTHIPANYLDELPNRERFLVEFTENERRQNLTWQERAQAIATYHKICLE